MPNPERKVKVKFKTWMKKHFPESWVYMPVPMGYGEHGIPDFICCVPMKIKPKHVGMKIGVFVGVEAKAQSGKLSDHQARQIERIKNANGIAFVIRGLEETFLEPMKALLRLLK